MCIIKFSFSETGESNWTQYIYDPLKILKFELQWLSRRYNYNNINEFFLKKYGNVKSLDSENGIENHRVAAHSIKRVRKQIFIYSLYSRLQISSWVFIIMIIFTKASRASILSSCPSDFQKVFY